MKGLYETRKGFKHYIIEAFDCDLDLNNNELLLSIAENICDKLKLNIIEKFVYEFKPYGLTYCFVLSNSHFVVHTWPEYNYLTLDVMSCSGGEFSNLKDLVKDAFKPKEIKIREIKYN